MSSMFLLSMQMMTPNKNLSRFGLESALGRKTLIIGFFQRLPLTR